MASRGRAVGIGLGAALFGFVSSCAGSRGGAPASQTPLAPENVSASAPFEPSGQAAEEYAAPTPQSARVGDFDPLARRLVDELGQAAAAANMPAPVRDRRLDRVAFDITRHVGVDEAPTPELVAFLLAHYGIVEPEPLLVRSMSNNEAGLVEHLRPRFPGFLARVPGGRLGLGVTRAAGMVYVTIALQEQPLELRPLPRRLPSSGSTKIGGRLLAPGHRSPQLLVTGVDGMVREVTVRPLRDGFEATLACGAGKGVLQVELAAEGPLGPGVLANFPVYCGIQAPRRAPALSVELIDPHPDAGDVERAVFDLANKDRAAVGLPLLRWSGSLAEVARAHSQEMAELGYVGHISPRTGDVNDRLRRAGLTLPPLLAENVARAPSASQAQRGFMASPGHRMNVVLPEVTHLGVGVAVLPPEGAGNTPVLLVTQLFGAGL